MINLHGRRVPHRESPIHIESRAGFLFPHLQVRDGNVEAAPLIGKYCGNSLPAPIVSSSNSLWIRFKSDNAVSHSGFRAVYTVGEILRHSCVLLVKVTLTCIKMSPCSDLKASFSGNWAGGCTVTMLWHL